MRPMTDQEKEMLQTMLDEVHQQFRDAVKEGRGFKDEQIAAISEGMIYTGEQAKENGLVDELGGIDEAIAKAGDMAGLGKNPVVDELGKVGLLDQLLQDMGGVQHGAGIADVLNPANSTGNLFYRIWSLVLLDPRVAGDDSGIRF
jgi:ClpP class serine protease